MSSDVAKQFLSDLQAQLQIETEWLLSHENGFEWWPGWLAQRIWLTTEVDNHTDVARLHIESALLRDVPDTGKTSALIEAGNRCATFSALVFSEGAVRLHASFSITARNASGIGRLALVAAGMQAADASAKVRGFASAFDGTLDCTRHPLAGIRKGGHSLLNTLLIVKQENDNATDAAGIDFSPLEELHPRPWVMAFTGVGGMTAELPFTGTQPALLSALTGEPSLGTALLQATTDFDHPQFGHGVLVRLTLPEPQGTPALANALNIHESETPVFGAHQLGAWCSHGDSLVFATFVPAVMFDWSLFGSMAYDAAGRALWAEALLVGREA